MLIFLIIILSVFFAMNMGGASFGASFATACGSNALNRRSAKFLFVIFVILGAVFLGENVSLTLGKNLVTDRVLSSPALIVIFLTAGLSMFTSNLMHIPQSTSLVTVASIAGVGVHYQCLSTATLMYMLPFWIILPILSYVMTYGMANFVYPPRSRNFWIYEKIVNKKATLERFVIAVSCFNAFSVGTNNVANVTGPVLGWVNWPLTILLILGASAYGMGAYAFTGPIKMASGKIVPLGLLTASIISIVSGTLMLFASWLGVPQSFIMLQMGALFAIASLKEGTEVTFQQPLTRKTLYTWTINPVITFLAAFGLAKLFL